jgi:hypothetical protein
MKFILSLLFLPLVCFGQTTFLNGVPKDLDESKIIFLKHESIKVTADPMENKAEKYIYHRQTTHNKVIEEANQELMTAAIEFPYEYAFATQSSYKNLVPAGYKYVLISQVYKNEYLKSHPKKNELIVFEYFILDVTSDIAYKVFEMDEMKVYDSKMLIRKLLKAVKKEF